MRFHFKTAPFLGCRYQNFFNVYRSPKVFIAYNAIFLKVRKQFLTANTSIRMLTELKRGFPRQIAYRQGRIQGGGATGAEAPRSGAKNKMK